MKHEKEHFRTVCEEYIRFRNDYITSKLLEVKADLKVSQISFKDDAVESMFKDLMNSHDNLITKIATGVYDELNFAINKGDIELALFHIDIPDILPVCLSGLGTLHAKSKKQNLFESRCS